MRHPIPFMFGSRLGFLASTDYIALFNLTAHELHELRKWRLLLREALDRLRVRLNMYFVDTVVRKKSWSRLIRMMSQWQRQCYQMLRRSIDFRLNWTIWTARSTPSHQNFHLVCDGNISAAFYYVTQNHTIYMVQSHKWWQDHIMTWHWPLTDLSAVFDTIIYHCNQSHGQTRQWH